jgi:hypothetical protein
VFHLQSPRLDKIEVEREGAARRAKLTYLRGRVGKQALAVDEKVMAEEQAPAGAKPAAEAKPAEAPAAEAKK